MEENALYLGEVFILHSVVQYQCDDLHVEMVEIAP